MKEFLYGRQPVHEALVAGRRQVFSILLARTDRPVDVLRSIRAMAQERAIPVHETDGRELDRVCGEVNHQGVAADVSGYPYEDLTSLLAHAQEQGEPPLLLILDHVQDPQNLGAILRAAETTGVHGVIIPRDRAVTVTAAAVRASAGAAEHLHVALVTNLAQTIESLKKHEIWVAGLEALPESRNYTEADLKGPLALVVGSEGSGLARLVRERCDFLIQLPMKGRINSLNVASATAVALFEIRRQRAATHA